MILPSLPVHYKVYNTIYFWWIFGIFEHNLGCVGGYKQSWLRVEDVHYWKSIFIIKHLDNSCLQLWARVGLPFKILHNKYAWFFDAQHCKFILVHI